MAENAFIRDYLCAVTQLPMMRPGAGVTGESRGLREALIPSPGDRAYVVSGPIGSLFETETPLGPWLRSLGGARGFRILDQRVFFYTSGVAYNTAGLRKLLDTLTGFVERLPDPASPSRIWGRGEVN
jgi:hypothetical protein